MDYQQTLEYLFTTTPSFQQVGADAYKPGLERIAEFCRLLGDPQTLYPTIHIAGTNGKGSVSHLITSVLMHAGYRVGLYTSPHIKDFRERMRVDGKMISEAEVVDFVARHRDEMKRLDLSFFEMTTAMAFDYFAREDVEVAVVETGLGGRLDATNLLRPLLSVVTNVGMDHTDLLGNTLQQVASEKAGIIKQGVPFVLGEANKEYNSVFEQRAQLLESPMIYAEQGFECQAEGEGAYTIKRLRDGHSFSLQLDLKGDYQRHNILTAAAALDLLHEHSPLTIGLAAFKRGMSSAAATTSLAGRWQTISERPLTICDTGHNAHAMHHVAEQLRRTAAEHDNLYCIIGFARDKDVEQALALLPTEAHYIFTAASTKRALPADELARLGEKVGLKGEVAPTVKQAIGIAQEKATADDVIFIGGSNYVVAEI